MPGYILAVLCAIGALGYLFIVLRAVGAFRPLRLVAPSSWTARHSVGIFFLYLLLMAAAAVLSAETAHALNIADSSGRYLVVQFAFTYALTAVAIVAVFFVASRGALPLEALGFRSASFATSLKRGFALFLLYLPMQILIPFLIGLAWNAVTGHYPEEQEAVRLIETASPALLAVIAVAACILAPFFEEVIFRAFIQRGLETTFGPGFAIVITTALFCGIHEGIAAKIALVPLALILSLAYHRSRDIVANITFHALFNAASLVVAVLSRR